MTTNPEDANTDSNQRARATILELAQVWNQTQSRIRQTNPDATQPEIDQACSELIRRELQPAVHRMRTVKPACQQNRFPNKIVANQ